MYISETDDTERSLAIELVLEDIPGGGVVDPDDFKTASTSMGEGALLGVSSGVYHLFKTAEIYEDEADSETDYKVEKGHEFVVGDFITDSGLVGAAEEITVIDTTTSALYDIFTVATTLGHAMLDGECIVQAAAQAAAGSAALLYSPVGMARQSVDLSVANQGCGIMVRGRVRESLLAYPVDANIKAFAALSLIRFV